MFLSAWESISIYLFVFLVSLSTGFVYDTEAAAADADDVGDVDDNG